METIKTFLEFEIISIKDHSLTVFNVLNVLLIIFITKLILWLIKKGINRQTNLKRIDKGSSFAFFQLIKYFIWIISIGIMFEALGIDLTFLMAGSAALLVGIGLGLQQTFNDFISGIILLFEQSVKVEDILDIDGDIVMIKEIGLRTSKGLNRDEIIITLPNSLITTNKVINWTNQSKQTLFKIDVGVAYGSDVDLVSKLLIESAKAHPDVYKKERIESRFVAFGNSSLDFKLLFFSENLFGIERVKSEIRIIINQKFIANNINIPFPQMDVHVKRT